MSAGTVWVVLRLFNHHWPTLIFAVVPGRTWFSKFICHSVKVHLPFSRFVESICTAFRAVSEGRRLFRDVRDPGRPSPGPAPFLHFFGTNPSLAHSANVPTRTTKEIAMDSTEHCRSQLAECRRLMSLAQSEAEATVLKLLVRSWGMIANQTDRYADLIQARK
jgi:hypothetical protein